MNGDDYMQKQKIPPALSVLSYLYFLIGMGILALGAFFVGLDISTKGLDLTSNSTILGATHLVIGLTLVGASRGLRRLSRGWRICALIFTWIGILGIIFEGCVLLAPQLQTVRHRSTGELSAQNIILLMVCALLFQLWQLRVLTRADVHDLFIYNAP
ncbi:MAG TPA: hypothetical protein VK742_20810 [Candidatus Sulfotelmatobacter sp.]|jgi:hypothetical protein|nr:hypothetical protein [Candidatus Sulfotelmatobacter sp.]